MNDHGDLVVGDAESRGDVRVIGIEVRAVDPRTGVESEIAIFPLSAVLKAGNSYDQMKRYSVTIHTTHGDVNMNAQQYIDFRPR